MGMFKTGFTSAFKHMIPEFHAFSDENRRYNIGATWTQSDGLRDYHNLEVKYMYNSERLALQGEPQPDGSWCYTEPSGHVHTISAERARMFMQQAQQQADIMMEMLEKLKKSGALDDVIDTSAEPA